MLCLFRGRVWAAAWFGLTLVLVIFMQVALLPASQAGSSQELRGVWLTNVDSDVLYSRDRLETALDQLASLNFNTIYPAAWNWGYTVYPSPTAQRVMGVAVDPRVPEWQEQDALANAVDLGHQKGFTVIPWFEFGFMTTAESEIAAAHPDWITQRQDGSQLWQDGIYQRRWLNPFKPEVQQFIQDLVIEIVSQYDIDGIQFDDHLGLPAEFGYDSYTLQLYRQEHRGKSPSSNPDDAEWVRWRADKITSFMSRLFRAIKAVDRNTIVSVSPNNYPFAYHHYLQDWQRWERQGLIEELVLQVYSTNFDHFIAALSRPEVRAAKTHIPVSIAILTGLRDLAVPIHQVEEQVWAVRDRQFAGVSFFFYESLWNITPDPRPARRAVFQRLFEAASIRPNLLTNWRP
ncbi:glycoside hydrolase family 10 protein [Phormidium tenue FACHB-886]|nr:glycoside hydrolase family 10 protein [Phormidium tenue FACHB-886]